MKVALINPPSPYLENDAAYPPSGLMYVAAAIERLGHDVTIIDLTLDSKALDDQKYLLTFDVFGITCVTPSLYIVREIIERLPDRLPKLVGGPHPTALPLRTLKELGGQATIVTGEAEPIMGQVLKDIESGRLAPIYNGGLAHPDDIPKPARHLLDLHEYYPGGQPTTPVYTSRGCPFDCAFCSKVSGRRYRTLPIDRVLEEIRDVKELGFSHVLFGDDDIGIDKKRLQELVVAVQPLDITFRLNQDARLVDRFTFALAAECGCTDISFGIESGSQRMLNAMNKRVTVEQNMTAIKTTKDVGLRARVYLVVNFPGENEQTIEETIGFMETARPDSWLLSNFAPLPGSRTFSSPGEYGINFMSPDWSKYYLVGHGGQFEPCFTTATLTFDRQRYLHDTLYSELMRIYE